MVLLWLGLLPCAAPTPPFLRPLWPIHSAAGVMLYRGFLFLGVATRRAAQPLLFIVLLFIVLPPFKTACSSAVGC